MREAGYNVVDLIEEQAALYPDRTAVISRTGETNYQELVLRMRSISALLNEKGIGPETAVGVCADRSLNWVAAFLGVLRSGGVYIPVNPMAPLQRKTQLVEDTRIRLLLAETYTLGMLPPSTEIEVLDESRTLPQPSGLRPPVIPSQTAYAISTSGSTAVPKSVAVCHESLWRYASTLRGELGLGSSDRYLQTASMEFSASIRQLVAPLVSGATLVLAPREEIRDPARLVFRMLHDCIGVFDTVPSYLRQWLAAVGELPADRRQELAASLKLVLSTGEPLTADTANSLRAAFPAVRISNLYGQTETTGSVAMLRVETPSADPIPIGRPWNECEFHVLNDELEAVMDGELYISGPSLARGYAFRPDITASHFLPNPFSKVSGDRIYRTGDRVRRRNDGTMEFVCRMNREVKFHGIRIELGEIESALRKHPDIQEAAVVLRPATGQEDRLVAFAVMRPGTNGSGDQALREFLNASLGETITPGVFVLTNALPRTESGKIDYPALMVAELSQTPRQLSSPPSTATEQLVAQCWEEILEVTSVAADDDFFALGGDSIQAMHMLVMIRQLIATSLPLGALFFQDPSLQAFAQAIDQAAEGYA